ncbi:MAG: sodium/solute symporter [Kiritimatiellales bacterium]|nr:sodium/solute symporter [Kiritimatiellales bacterium]
MGFVDIAVFVLFVISVVGIGLWKSKGAATHSEHGAADYFLAGRGLTWWLVGFSLIAANISTEQFVGMSGQAADWLGMAIASYEWMAAITLVVVAFVFLPKFLKSGIYTIPEFLGYRYNGFARTVMAIATMIILVGVPTASVIFSGAKVITVFFQGQSFFGLDLGNITVGCWIIGIMAAIYVAVGGLKACAWADLIQGAALILGGLVILVFVMKALGAAEPHLLLATAADPSTTVDSLQGGAISRFFALNKAALPAGKLHMIRPASDPAIPWPALVVGLWIPNFFYWGLNQYITQRTLGSKSLSEGQKGVVFAAALKLIIPFAVVIPGILAFNLFSKDLKAQADVKNVPIIQQFEEKADKVFLFDAHFAKENPAIAAQIMSYNAGKAGVLPSTEGSLDEINSTLVTAATAKGMSVSQKLVGYDFDAAFPTLLRRVVPRGNGILGFVLAAIFGAVVSSLASMLNSASTIFTMDIYHKVKKSASQFELVTVGRICTMLFVLIAILIAPNLGRPQFGGIFTFIQEFQGFISPGILAIFLFGMLVPKAPRIVGTVGLLLNPVLYGGLKFLAPQIAFLNRMAICFGAVLLVLTLITLIKPLAKPIELPVNDTICLRSSLSAKIGGILVVLLTLSLYIIFW